MDNETLFYVSGIALAVSAVVFTVLALRLEKFPGRAAPIVAVWFIALVGCTTTFAVLHAKEEKEHEEHALSAAGHEAEEEEAEAESGEDEAEGGTTLKLAADPTALAYDATSLEAKAGRVTIDFSNPSSIEHDVAIEQDGKEIAASLTITNGETTVTADLAPGTYAFLCTVPGHAEAGMEGSLAVK